jgi:uncharacterized protein (TIGR03435 family)
VLTVGKKGPKMTQSEEEPAKKDDAKEPDEPLPPPGMGRGGRGNMTLGKDGFPEMPVGRRGGPSIFMMRGKAKLTAERMTMAEFVDQIERFLTRPVVDQTELTGKYDFVLYFAPDMSAVMGGRGGAPPPPGGGGRGEIAGGGDDSETGPTIFVAVQEQLGLKLESQKATVDVLVIDHMEKAPTEN